MFTALIPLNREFTAFDGFFTIAGEDFRVSIRLPENKSMKEAIVVMDWKLQFYCQPIQSLIHRRLNQCPDVATFMQELQKILEKESKTWNHLSEAQVNPQYYNHLLKELEEIGWGNVVFVSDNFDEVHIKTTDEAEREHLLQLKFSSQYPEESPKFVTLLPTEFHMHWNTTNTVSDAYEWFKQQVGCYQNMWNQLDEIDEKTWVLEPENPNRKDTERRIALGTAVSLHFSVDPHCPTAVPDCVFLGSDQAATPLREKFNTNISNWNVASSILNNLENVLEMQLPLRLETKKEDFAMDCGICYSYRLDDAIPNKACDDSRCQQPFHDICLYKWLRSLTTSRQSFNVIFGQCPYCNKPITCKIPNCS